MGIQVITTDPPKVEQFSFEHIIDALYVENPDPNLERMVKESLVRENNIPPLAKCVRTKKEPYGYRYLWTWSVTTFD